MLNFVRLKINAPDRQSDSESGIGLIEVVVAFVLFGILSALFIPVLITSIKIGARNSILGESSHLINEVIERGRGASTYQSCENFTNNFGGKQEVYDNIRGGTLTVSTNVYRADFLTGQEVLLTPGEYCDDKIVRVEVVASIEHSFDFKNPILVTTADLFLIEEVGG